MDSDDVMEVDSEAPDETCSDGGIWKTLLASPKYVVAPMVDMSELAFRMLCRRYGADLCYSPMLHANKYVNDPIYRKNAFTTCEMDRPLIVQFCANDPETFAKAAKLVEPYCDGVDLNLGCPQLIAKRGHYGSFLQDEWQLLTDMVQSASASVSIPISCKIRVFPDTEKTIRYAQMLEAAGCKFLAMHGRTRDQKKDATGLANWDIVKAVKDNVSIPVISNGNVLSLADVHRCLDYTGVDAVMSAEGILHNPALFTGQNPPVWEMVEEFLQLCQVYPTEHGHIRTHLFRIYANCLPHYRDLQTQLGQVNSLEKLKAICSQLKSRLAQISGVTLPCTPDSTELPSSESQRKIHGKSDSVAKEEEIQPEKPSRVLCNETTEVTAAQSDPCGVAGQLSEKDGNRATAHGHLPIWLCHSRPRLQLDKEGDSVNRKPIAGLPGGGIVKLGDTGDKPGSEEDLPGTSATPDDDDMAAKVKKLPRSQKKKLKMEQRREGQKIRRKLAKEERKKRKAEQFEAKSSQGAESESRDPEHVNKKQRVQQMRDRCLEALKTGQRVCVDLSMEKLMTQKECSRLAQQLGRTYGVNRQSEAPFHIYFTGCDKKSFLYKESVRKNPGFENYMVDISEKPHHELFECSEIVQLSPDSPNVLETVDKTKVYVIGGLVDENIQKGVTQELAEKSNITSARLPINEYMEKAGQGTFKKVLSVNQVFDILMTFTLTQDWGQALLSGMPSRQGYVLKSKKDPS